MRRQLPGLLCLVCLSLVLAACGPQASSLENPTPAPTSPQQPVPTQALAPTQAQAPAPTQGPAPTQALAPTKALPPATQPPTPAATEPPTAVPEPQATPAAAAAAVAPAGPPMARLAAGQPVTVTALHMLDANTGWAVAQATTDLDSRILQTADGAKTWRDVTPPEPASAPNSDLGVGKSAVLFAPNAQEAWVAFGYPPGAPVSTAAIVTWATRDGGRTWTPSAPLSTESLQSYWPSDLVFVDDHSGWLLSHVGAGMNHDYVVMYATQDGGATWTVVVDPMALPETGYLGMSCYKSGMTFVDAKQGWVAGNCHGVVPGAPYLYQTTDGGHTWQRYTLPPPADAPDLYTNESMACGAGAPIFLSPTEGRLPVSCQGLDNKQSRGWLYITVDGGKTWTTRPLPAPYGDLQILNANQAWWVGSASTDPTLVRQLYGTQDGGKTWTALKQLNWGGQVDFVDAQTGWAVAKTLEATALVQTKDGGLKWSLMTPKAAP